MSASEILIQIIGGVCLLLWGVSMVNKGLNQAFGSALRRIISNSTSNRIKAFFVGMAAVSHGRLHQSAMPLSATRVVCAFNELARQTGPLPGQQRAGS